MSSIRSLLLLVAATALLISGCSSPGSSGAPSSAPASLALRVVFPEATRNRLSDLALLIIRVVDAEDSSRDVISATRVDLTGLTDRLLVQSLTGISPGNRRVLLESYDGLGNLAAVGDSGPIELSAGALVTLELSLVAPEVNRLVFVTHPSNAVVATALAPPVQVAVEDPRGNRLTSSSARITLSLVGPAGALGGTATVAASNGLATFSDLSVDRVGQGFQLLATSAGLLEATSDPFNIAAAAARPASLAFATQPVDTVAGQVIVPAIQVTVLDAAGTVVPTATNPITVSLSGGVLSGTVSVSAVNGVATFSTLSGSPAAPGLTLAASSPGLTGATSASFNLLAPFGPPAQLAFVTQPVNSQARETMPNVQVEVIDAAGVRVTSATNPITLILSTNPGPATLTGSPTVNAVNGLASFADLKLSKSGTGYVLEASSPGLVLVNSNPFDQSLPRNALIALPDSPFGPYLDPLRASLSPDGQFFYCTQFQVGANDVLQFSVDAVSGELTPLVPPTVAAGTQPGGVAVSPDNLFAFAANAAGNTISLYNLVGGALLPFGGPVPTGGLNPLGVTVRPGAAPFLYACNLFGPSSVAGFSIGAGPTLTPLPGSPYAIGGVAGPSNPEVTPDGSFLYLNTGDGFAINPLTGVLTLLAGSPFGLGGGSYQTDIHPSGSRYYGGADAPATLIQVLDINPTTGVMTNISGSPFPVAENVGLLACSPDGEMLYTAAAGSTNIRLYALDPVTGAPAEIDDSPLATGLTNNFSFVQDPLGRFLYVTHRGPTNLISGYQIVP